MSAYQKEYLWAQNEPENFGVLKLKTSIGLKRQTPSYKLTNMGLNVGFLMAY